jgi:hypothetical protein
MDSFVIYIYWIFIDGFNYLQLHFLCMATIFYIFSDNILNTTMSFFLHWQEFHLLSYLLQLPPSQTLLPHLQRATHEKRRTVNYVRLFIEKENFLTPETYILYCSLQIFPFIRFIFQVRIHYIILYILYYRIFLGFLYFLP